MSEDSGFLSRWARRKSQARSGGPVPPGPGDSPAIKPSQPSQPSAGSMARSGAGVGPGASAVITTPPSAAGAGSANGATTIPQPEAPPVPTLADVEALAPGEEVSRFVARGVDETVKRAAVRKLFTDPHFNIMDGLDIYIDDYGKPDPIPMSMLRQMNQSRALGLFAAEEEAQAQAARGAQGTAEIRQAPGAPEPDRAPDRPPAEAAVMQGAPATATREAQLPADGFAEGADAVGAAAPAIADDLQAREAPPVSGLQTSPT